MYGTQCFRHMHSDLYKSPTVRSGTRLLLSVLYPQCLEHITGPMLIYDMSDSTFCIQGA